MTTTRWILGGVLIIVVAIGAIASMQKKTPPPVEPVPQQEVSAQPDPGQQLGMSAQSDTTDAGLEKDVTAIENQLSGLTNDVSAIDASLKVSN